jgi:hypothetical protein
LVWLIFQRTTLLKLLRSFHSLISFFGEGIVKNGWIKRLVSKLQRIRTDVKAIKNQRAPAKNLNAVFNGLGGLAQINQIEIRFNSLNPPNPRSKK